MDELKKIAVTFTADITEFQQGISKIKSDLSSLGKTTTKSNAFSTIANDAKKASTSISASSNKIKDGINKVSSNLKQLARFGRFFVFSYLGRQIAGLTKNMMVAGANMAEIQNLFEVSFGAMADAAEEFANKLETSWGVSATLTKQQTAYLNNMLKSMGMAEDMAYGMSTGLVQLSYNIASLYDISQKDAFDKLRSAMVGISRPLLQLGINTKVAELQQVAFRNGITSTNRELTQQEKILATYWAIYEQTRSSWQSGSMVINGQTVAIGDMTKTIGSNANMIRVLQSRLSDLGRYWGLAFQPIVKYVIPVVYLLIKALTELGKRFALFIGNLFGGSFKSIEEMMGEFGTADVVSDNGLADYFDEVGNGADKAKKKVDKLTGSIDELNILSEPDTSGLGGFDMSMGGIENNIGLPDMDYIPDEVISGVVDERIAELKSNLLGLLKPLKQFGSAMLGAFVSGSIIAGIALFIKHFKDLYNQFKLFSFVAQFGFVETLKTIGSILVGLLSPIGLLIAALGVFTAGFTYLIATSEEFRNNILGHLTEIGEMFIGLGQNIYNNFIEPVIGYFAMFIENIWDNGLGSLIEKISYFVLEVIKMITSILNFLSVTVLPAIISFVGFVLNALAPIINFITSILSTVIDVFTNVVIFIRDVFLGDWNSVWKSIANIFIGMINFLITAVESFLNFFIDGINALIGSFQWMNPALAVVGLPQLTSNTFSRFNLGRVPTLASGGIAYGETMAVVGEYANARSNPEVVAPLDKLEELIGGTSGTTQEELLREQNELLRAILDKDTDVKLDGRTLARAIDKNKGKLGYAIIG